MSKIFPAMLQAAAFLASVVAAPALADPPPWAPAHGHRARQHVEAHRYVYYPVQQVYYAPDQQIWFWMSNGGWQLGVTLPGDYRIGTSAGVPVVLHSERPYVEHAYVEQRYGRPWRESHGEGRQEKRHGNKHH